MKYKLTKAEFDTLSAERFRELQFDKNFAPLSLTGMRKLEPEAFEKAGL